MAVSDGMVMPGIVYAKDMSNGGPGSISGQVLVDATEAPLARKVRLVVQRSGHFIRQTWSDSNGDYSFDYIRTDQKYIVYALDYEETYDVVAASGVNAT